MLILTTLVIVAGLGLLAMAAPSPIIKGITTLRWGTGSAGVVTGTALAGAILKKVAHATRGGDPTLIEDNNGFTAAVVLLHDGDTLTFTCVDDTAITWPAKGDIAQYKVPGWVAAKGFLIVDNNADLERKREGERVIKAEYYVGMDPLT